MNELYFEKLLFDLGCTRTIKMIKVTSDFGHYLVSILRPDMLCEKADISTGYISKFTGLPIVVDDTIYSDYYELVF